MKKCRKCGSEKDFSEFYVKPSSSSGMTAQCKSCIRQDVKERWHSTDKHNPRLHEKRLAYSRQWHLDNGEKHRRMGLENRRRLRASLFNHYGWSCACCGEDRYEFLSIDHINGGGAKHRR